MKQKLKKTAWHHYLLFCFLALVLFFACRKVEITSTSISTEEKFFSNHPTSDSKLNAIINYVKRQNDKKHFVNKVVDQIGYPYWDKSLVLNSNSKTMKGKSDSGINVFVIPFVRDNQNAVNACLQVLTTATDTTIKYLCDWQYRDTVSAGIGARQQTLLLMQLDKQVFGSRVYKIKDSSCIGLSDSGRVIRYLKLNNSQMNRSISNPINGKTNSLSILTIEHCVMIDDAPLETNDGWITGQGELYTFGVENCWYEYYFFETGGGGSGTGGDENGGEGGGDDGTPPPCNGSGGRTNKVTNPCEPGWIPLDDDETSTALPMWIIDSLQTPCFITALRKISSGPQNTFFKDIYNIFDTSSSLHLTFKELDSITDAYGQAYPPVQTSYGPAVLIELNKKDLKKCSQEYISYVLMHEVVHAAMFANVIVWDSTNTQHVNMINSYLDKMANSLTAGYTNLSLFDAYSICYWSFSNAIDGNTPSQIFLTIMMKQVRLKLNNPSLQRDDLIQKGEKYTDWGNIGTRLCR